MPRIYTSASDPIDFCNLCMPEPDDAETKYGDVGDGPDGRGNCFDYEADHPPYEDDPHHYRCDHCGRRLTQKDN